VVNDAEGERLQKVLARTGFGSRRVCEDLIFDGRVTVDGEVAILGRRVDPDVAQIFVDGVPIPTMPGLVHYLLNKPAKVVSTAADPEGRPTVVDLVPREPRVFSVGRLDYDTEGLLLLTNDGAFAQMLTHPSHGVEKEYLVEVGGGALSPAALRSLREGVELEDGMTAPARVAELDAGLLKIVIHEGRNRQVRRMCEAVGHPVLRLVRMRIGNLADQRLKPGEWRHLTLDEVLALGEVAVKGRQPTRKGSMRGTTIRS
jgi:23S rRNA pseudouridine2605 synthase